MTKYNSRIVFGLDNVSGVNENKKIVNVLKFMSQNKLDYGIFTESHFDSSSISFSFLVVSF